MEAIPRGVTSNHLIVLTADAWCRNCMNDGYLVAVSSDTAGLSSRCLTNTARPEKEEAQMNRTWFSITVTVVAQLFLIAHAAYAGEPAVVPEPGTLGLLGSGAALASLVAWWRYRK